MIITYTQNGYIRRIKLGLSKVGETVQLLNRLGHEILSIKEGR